MHAEINYNDSSVEQSKMRYWQPISLPPIEQCAAISAF